MERKFYINNMKMIRDEKQLNFFKVCKELRMEVGELSWYEMGRRKPTDATLKKIAQVYGVTQADFIFQEVSKLEHRQHYAKG